MRFAKHLAFALVAMSLSGCATSEHAFASPAPAPVAPAQPQVPQEIPLKTETINALLSFLNDSQAVFRINGMKSAEDKAASFIQALQTQATQHIQTLNAKETEKKPEKK